MLRTVYMDVFFIAPQLDVLTDILPGSPFFMRYTWLSFIFFSYILRITPCFS